MKIVCSFVVVVVAFFCFAYVTCDTPSLAVTPGSEVFKIQSNSQLHVAVYQDILIHASYASSSSYRINIRRRNADGFYSLIQSPDVDVGDNYIPVTNGKWLAMTGSYSSWIGLLNPTTGEVSNFTSLVFNLYSAKFLDEDTIVFWNNKDGSLTTIGFVDGRWIEIGTRFSLDYASYASSNPTATWPGNYFLAISSDTSLRIYERLSNATWVIADSIDNIGGYISQSGVTVYNGNDMVFGASPYQNDLVGNQVGRLSIFKKTNNQWNLEQQFLLNDLGVNSSIATAGFGLVMLDDNTVLFGVPVASDDFQRGIVFVIQRNQNGNWSVIQTFYTDEPVQFGYQIFTNDYDIVFSGVNSTGGSAMFFSISKCYNSPINVTCNDLDLVVDLSECKFNTSTTSSLYTINNLQCGPVTSTKNQTTVVSSVEVSVEYSFSRYLVNGSCTSRITCSKPPTTTPTKKTSNAHLLYKGITVLSFLLVLMTL